MPVVLQLLVVGVPVWVGCSVLDQWWHELNDPGGPPIPDPD